MHILPYLAQMLFFNRTKNIDQLSDEKLIDLYQRKGDEACIGELYERHYDKIYVVARNMVQDREAAKDIVMTVFEKVMRSLGNTDVQSFSNWLFIITRNECNQYLRKHSSTVKKMTEWGDFQKSTSNFVESGPLERLLIEEQDTSTRSSIADAMDQLKDEQRICVRLFYYEDKSYREIAAETGYTEKEVKSYLQNGKKKLEKILSPS